MKDDQPTNAKKVDIENTSPKDDFEIPKVWTCDLDHLGGRWGKVNRPTSGPTHQKDLPVGKHPLQLYSLATPNGVKATIMLEELVEAGGITGAEYDGWLVPIDGEQFGSGFCELNPNSKIPAMMDHAPLTTTTTDDDDDKKPLRVFESGNILLYLAEKFQMFLPTDLVQRTECLSWLFWQIGSAPYLGGGFGHFFSYAPFKQEYPINRFTMETKRQLDVLNKHLASRTYMLGDDYTIADMAIWPWYGQLVLGNGLYTGSYEFLNIAAEYPNVIRWANEIWARPAVKRGKMVNKNWGPLEEQLPERHDASDFETKTESSK